MFRVNCLATVLLSAAVASGEVCNLKVVTDASPDYSDLPSFVSSATSAWPTPAEKCWAVFYWNHIARRQTAPMVLHGLALTDPIRQGNDHGFTMCSTISGINQSIWEAMGLKHRYWDIANHTVPEVFYDGRWHMYDNSMSALYTLCDGKTLAGVEDIGKEGACEASGGKAEIGHVAKYHCLYATGTNGFLSGADCARSLEEEAHCFSPKALKLRTYFYDWDYGHRYILNLRPGETYTRYYRSRGDGADYFVPNGGKDPELVGKYGQRGNGAWVLRPSLAPADWQKAAYSATKIAAGAEGLHVEEGATSGEVIYKVQSANVITSQVLGLKLVYRGNGNAVAVAVSTNNGRTWKDLDVPHLTDHDQPGTLEPVWNLRDEVSGAYEVLVRVMLLAPAVSLGRVEIQTTTQLNAKTQPRLNLGKNTVYVGAGVQTDSIVFWPELQNGRYKEHVVEEKNIACDPKHVEYQGVIYPAAPKEDAYIVYRLDAPRDLTRLTFGGRFYNRAPKSHIDLLWSLDGQAWTPAWSLTSTEQPWDVIHYETVDLPKGHRAVWVKYLMNCSTAEKRMCSIYAVRMEANHLPADPAANPVEVTFTWSERQTDRTLVERSHTQVVARLPARYTINVGGADHPVVNALRVNLQGAVPDSKPGYSDGKDAGGEKWAGQWLTVGKNLALGKSYTLSLPSESNWGAGDPDGKKLTDGVAGPPYAGGVAFKYGACWGPKKNPVVTLDLGAAQPCASFGLNANGYPWDDALSGQVKDKIEVLVSTDGTTYTSLGFINTDWRWKDLPVNHMWPDHERIEGATFRLVPPQPVTARYVQYKIATARFLCVTELEVLDAFKSEPFDLLVALPDK